MDGLQFVVALVAPWLIKRELDQQRFAMDGASRTYFIGTKIEAVISDAEIIKKYFGRKQLNHTCK
jgi:hypothetical protein